jgi:hypothetical protein
MERDFSWCARRNEGGKLNEENATENSQSTALNWRARAHACRCCYRDRDSGRAFFTSFVALFAHRAFKSTQIANYMQRTERILQNFPNIVYFQSVRSRY